MILTVKWQSIVKNIKYILSTLTTLTRKNLSSKVPPNLTALRRGFKPKNPTKGGKGAEQDRAEEEAKRRQEEA